MAVLIMQRPVIEEVLKLSSGLLSVISNGSNYEAVTSMTKALVGNVKDGAIDLSHDMLGDKRSDAVMRHIDKIMAVFGDNTVLTGQDIKAIYTSVIDLAKTISTIVSDISLGRYANVVDDMRDLIVDIVAVSEALIIGAKKMANFIKMKLDPVIDKIQVKIEAFSDKVGQKIDKIQDKFEAIGDDMKDKFEDFAEDSKEAFGKIEAFFDRIFHKDSKNVATKMVASALVSNEYEMDGMPVSTPLVATTGHVHYE
jgi:hypothetical protein